jgi:hypothetical protein
MSGQEDQRNLAGANRASHRQRHPAAGRRTGPAPPALCARRSRLPSGGADRTSYLSSRGRGRRRGCGLGRRARAVPRRRLTPWSSMPSVCGAGPNLRGVPVRPTGMAAAGTASVPASDRVAGAGALGESALAGRPEHERTRRSAALPLPLVVLAHPRAPANASGEASGARLQVSGRVQLITAISATLAPRSPSSSAAPLSRRTRACCPSREPGQRPRVLPLSEAKQTRRDLVSRGNQGTSPSRVW